jgi:hypothetical protein
VVGSCSLRGRWLVQRKTAVVASNRYFISELLEHFKITLLILLIELLYAMQILEDSTIHIYLLNTMKQHYFYCYFKT